MKKSISVSFAILATSLCISQTSPGYIEIGVAEAVDLKVEEITVQLVVSSASSQMEDEFYYGYYEDDYYEYEEDYLYEQMMEDSPKKVTSEMKRDYENRQRAREDRELERERKQAEFKPYWAKQFIDLMKTNNIVFTIQLNERDEEYYDYERTDTAFQVVLKSGEEYDKLNSLMEEHPVYVNRTDEKYESMDSKYATVIPMLTAKAKNQAELLAIAMGKKVGNVTQVTNNFKSKISDMALEEMYDYSDYDYEGEYDSWSSNPFEDSKKAFVQYLFRFAVVN